MSEHQEVLPESSPEAGQWAGPAHRSRRSGSGGPPRSPWLRRLLVAATAFVVVVAAALIWVDSQVNPGGRRGPQVSVTIPKGASTTRIGDILAGAGVIHGGTLFAWWVRLHSDGPLYPGKYVFDKNSSYGPVISALEAGPKILTVRLLVAEGYTVAGIADAVGKLPGLNLSAAKFLAAATDGTVRSRYEPAGVNNLEGLLFPATYEVREGETESELLQQMVTTFEDHAASAGIDSAAASLGMTPYQVITVASIVEREAKRDVDRANVASVIYNRLKVGMPLGADSTQTYFLRLTDPGVQPTPAQLDAPSPYNTRTNKGLPPTPIASPGIPSLRAAASPASTTYLYFVEINPDGELGFASTTAGFLKLQQECRAANLC